MTVVVICQNRVCTTQNTEREQFSKSRSHIRSMEAIQYASARIENNFLSTCNCNNCNYIFIYKVALARKQREPISTDSSCHLPILLMNEKGNSMVNKKKGWKKSTQLLANMQFSRTTNQLIIGPIQIKPNKPIGINFYPTNFLDSSFA